MILEMGYSVFKNWINDTWEKFNCASFNKKIVIWGAGKRCIEWLPLWKLTYNICYIVDSDENKWNDVYCGIKVCSPRSLLNEEKNSYVVLICGQYAGEIALELENMGVTEYYSEYWMNNPQIQHAFRRQCDIPQEEIEVVCSYMADEQSKSNIRKIVEKRKMGVCDYSDIMSVGEEYFREDIFQWSSNEVYVDAGAFDGDSIVQFIKRNPNYKKIYAFEADRRNYELLRSSYIYQAFKEKINIFNRGVWNQYETVNFAEGMETSSSAMSECALNMNEVSSIDMQIKSVECVPLDAVIPEEVTFIKMDIEGSEMRALSGARRIIMTCKPKLAICIYHKLDDLWRIPQYIHSLVPEYRFYVRHHSILYVDTVLYATI